MINYPPSILILILMATVSIPGTKLQSAPTNGNGEAKTSAIAPTPTGSTAATPASPVAVSSSTNPPVEPSNPDSSSALTSEAWQAWDKKDYATAKARIAKCRELYETKAVEMQAGLTSLPAPDKAHSYWALNDVGTCIFILGKVTEAEGKPKEALSHYREVVDRFAMAQCWDKQGWFWQPAVASKERIAALTLETAE